MLVLEGCVMEQIRHKVNVVYFASITGKVLLNFTLKIKSYLLKYHLELFFFSSNHTHIGIIIIFYVDVII